MLDRGRARASGRVPRGSELRRVGQTGGCMRRRRRPRRTDGARRRTGLQSSRDYPVDMEGNPSEACSVTPRSCAAGWRSSAEQMQCSQKVAWADNAIKLAVDMTVASIGSIELTGTQRRAGHPGARRDPGHFPRGRDARPRGPRGPLLTRQPRVAPRSTSAAPPSSPAPLRDRRRRSPASSPRAAHTSPWSRDARSACASLAAELVYRARRRRRRRSPATSPTRERDAAGRPRSAGRSGRAARQQRGLRLARRLRLGRPRPRMVEMVRAQRRGRRRPHRPLPAGMVEPRARAPSSTSPPPPPFSRCRGAATYAATQAFVLSFSEAIRPSCRQRGHGHRGLPGAGQDRVHRCGRDQGRGEAARACSGTAPRTSPSRRSARPSRASARSSPESSITPGRSSVATPRARCRSPSPSDSGARRPNRPRGARARQRRRACGAPGR